VTEGASPDSGIAGQVARLWRSGLGMLAICHRLGVKQREVRPIIDRLRQRQALDAERRKLRRFALAALQQRRRKTWR
jgi:hypothetical protein